jgi:hypothetical protein
VLLLVLPWRGSREALGVAAFPGQGEAQDVHSFRGCDEPECVVPLCRAHHREFDDGRLDLLPHVSGQGFEAELAHMQRHYGDPLSVVYRLSGCRWVPEEAA